MFFPQLQGKCQGKTRKDGARSALFQIFVLFYVYFVLLYVFLCCSMYCSFCDLLCIVCVCICVLNYCHRVATHLQLNISYHISAHLILREKKRVSNLGRNNTLIKKRMYQHDQNVVPFQVIVRTGAKIFQKSRNSFHIPVPERVT